MLLPDAVLAAQVADDINLIRAAQRDRSAFGALYERYIERVYRYTMARVGNAEDAEDITAQTFMAAMERIGRYRADGAFGAWLFGIARHKIADHFRAGQPALDLEEADWLDDGQPPVDDAVAQHLQVAHVAAKLRALAPDRAEVVALRFFGHLDVAEIAVLMERQEPAVRMLLHRGLRDLQHLLEGSREGRS